MVSSPLIVVPPALVYALAVLPDLGTVLPAVADPRIAGVAALLGTPVGAAAGWAHFIAFDLFVGRWCHLDARERGIHPLVMAPVLLLTILLAPLGLLAHLVVRAVAPVREPSRAG
ncbi:ABA4-like family protein [Pseudonocardia broussonetiae]|uniref:ABA4-like family protein n=1 Tax=Pseudonocardia broussonetiae TaxID=2736640 RepID=UPI003B82DBDA